MRGMEDGSVESPCVRICRLNADEVCVGCGRNLEEITDWSRLSDEEKLAVWAKLPERIALIESQRAITNPKNRSLK